jgi:flagellar motility protein MotE (MotC chaperone)
MRRLIIICEILVVLLIVIKIGAAAGLLQKVMPEATFFELDHAIANVSQRAPDTVPAREVAEDAMAKERKLAASLAEREKQLDGRENAIREEEKKLQGLKSEIIAKIDTLKGLEDKLSGMLDSVKSVEDKRLKDLATVFEATTPAQAGTMLEKMDKKLAAGIIMNMKSKKAGAVWGQIDPQRAAEIAKEITGAPRAGADQAKQ